MFTALLVLLLQALVAARDAAPGEWAEAERQRLARRAAQLDEGLAKERQKRLHAARLLRALKKLDEEDGVTDGKGLNRSVRLCCLRHSGKRLVILHRSFDWCALLY